MLEHINFDSNGIHKDTGTPYDFNGFDIRGFNAQGHHKFTGKPYDPLGYSRDGYKKNGYDKDGYTRDGYDKNDFDSDGFDRNGYDHDGYDIDGYNRKGWNTAGIFQATQTSYDIDGYDLDGYDKNDFDSDGYDRDGYNKSDFDRDGYDRNGYDKDGYDINCYDKDDYDKDGYAKNGFNKDGYGRDGYNRDNYNQEGYNRNGYNEKGFHRSDYDENKLIKNCIIRVINNNIVDKITYKFNEKKVTTYNKSGHIVSYWEITYNQFIKYISAINHYSFRKKYFKNLKTSERRVEKNTTQESELQARVFPLLEIDPLIAKEVNFKEGEILKKYPNLTLSQIKNIIIQSFKNIYWDYKKKKWMKLKYDSIDVNINTYNDRGFDAHKYHKFTGTLYDPLGYDQKGYDKHGFNKNGYTKNGYGKDGYKKDGWHKSGLHRESGSLENCDNKLTDCCINDYVPIKLGKKYWIKSRAYILEKDGLTYIRSSTPTYSLEKSIKIIKSIYSNIKIGKTYYLTHGDYILDGSGLRKINSSYSTYPFEMSVKLILDEYKGINIGRKYHFDDCEYILQENGLTNESSNSPIYTLKESVKLIREERIRKEKAYIRSHSYINSSVPSNPNNHKKYSAGDTGFYYWYR